LDEFWFVARNNDDFQTLEPIYTEKDINHYQKREIMSLPITAKKPLKAYQFPIEPKVHALWEKYWEKSSKPVNDLLALETVNPNERDLFAAKMTRTVAINFLKSAQKDLGKFYTIKFLESKVFLERFARHEDAPVTTGAFLTSELADYQGFLVLRCPVPDGKEKPIFKMN
jgi:hypothetical protein